MNLTKPRIALLLAASLTVTGVIGYVVGSDEPLFQTETTKSVAPIEQVPFDAVKMLQYNDLAETNYLELFKEHGGAGSMSAKSPYVRASDELQTTLESFRDELVAAQTANLSPAADAYRERVLTSVATTLAYLRALEQHAIFGDGLYGNQMPDPPSDAHKAERIELLRLAEEQYPCWCINTN